jgi:hypothetical protein
LDERPAKRTITGDDLEWRAIVRVRVCVSIDEQDQQQGGMEEEKSVKMRIYFRSELHISIISTRDRPPTNLWTRNPFSVFGEITGIVLCNA